MCTPGEGERTLPRKKKLVALDARMSGVTKTLEKKALLEPSTKNTGEREVKLEP